MNEHFHNHSHNHSHDHNHIPNDKKILVISFSVISIFMVVEFVAGYAFNSLTLMADAGHMANDSLSLLLALIALFLSTQKQKILALINGLSLVFVAIWIVIEAIERYQNPLVINALPVILVAFLGLLVNIMAAYMMLKADHNNLNVKAAYLHILADMQGLRWQFLRAYRRGRLAWCGWILWQACYLPCLCLKVVCR